MEKRKTGWLHPAHGEKEKRAAYIQPMELKTIEKNKHGLVSRKGERRAIYREICLPQSVDGVIVLSEILS